MHLFVFGCGAHVILDVVGLGCPLFLFRWHGIGVRKIWAEIPLILGNLTRPTGVKPKGKTGRWGFRALCVSTAR